MRNLFRKGIVIGLITLCFAALGSVIYLDEHFYRSAPRKPDPSSGRVYAQTIHHGALVYLTRTEKLPFDYSWYAFPLFAVPAYLLNQRWKVFRNPKEATSAPPKRKRFRPVVAALFGGWCLYIAGSTMSDRLLTEVDGKIIERNDANGYNRPGAIYTLSDSNGESKTYVTGATDATLPGTFRVGDYLSKKKWQLSYSVNGRNISNFPLIFYGIMSGFGFSLVTFSLVLAIQQRRRNG